MITDCFYYISVNILIDFKVDRDLESSIIIDVKNALKTLKIVLLFGDIIIIFLTPNESLYFNTLCNNSLLTGFNLMYFDGFRVVLGSKN